MENEIRLKAVKVSDFLVERLSNHFQEIDRKDAFVWVGSDTDYKQQTIDWLFLYTLGLVHV